MATDANQTTRLSPTFDPEATAEILLAASKRTDHGTPTVLTDGGIENFNGAVDELIRPGRLQGVLAGTEITYSHSMIESWWRVLKHQWLYLNSLDTVATVRKLMAFYVEQHNSQLPHSAFHGQTPDEMYFGPEMTFRRYWKPPGNRHAKPGRIPIGTRLRGVSSAVCEPQLKATDPGYRRGREQEQMGFRRYVRVAWVWPPIDTSFRQDCRLDTSANGAVRNYMDLCGDNSRKKCRMFRQTARRKRPAQLDVRSGVKLVVDAVEAHRSRATRA